MRFQELEVYLMDMTMKLITDATAPCSTCRPTTHDSFGCFFFFFFFFFLFLKVLVCFPGFSTSHFPGFRLFLSFGTLVELCYLWQHRLMHTFLLIHV